jgi:hypothetical protein
MYIHSVSLLSSSLLTQNAASVASLLGISGRSSNKALDLEHALIMVLLLMELLSIRGERRRYVPWVVVTGIALSLFTPLHNIEAAWPYVSALALPPLLWQVGIRLATVKPVFVWRGWLAWLLTALFVALTLKVGGAVPTARSALFGLLAVSLLWQVRESASGITDLGAFGQLALALLIAEVDLTVEPIQPFLGTVFSGAGSGLLMGYLGVRIAFRLSTGEWRNLFCLGLAYLAYLAGLLIGTSGVVAVASAGLMVAVYGYNTGLWPTLDALPAPLNRRGVFLLLTAIWLLLGWQAHVPLTTRHVLGISLGLTATAAGLLLGRWLLPIQATATQSLLDAMWRKERKVFLLLAGTLLLWPQGAKLELWPLVAALVAAIIAVVILRITLYPVFDLFGIQLRQPDDHTA